jgi:MFS family permease
MHDSDPDQYPSPAYAWYVVGVLTLAYVLSFIDRQILNLLVGPIQRDLGIGDTEMSLLMGLTFAVFYTLFGIMLGRLADTRSRRGIISVGIGLWSLMTAGCGVTKRFWELALMRMGVGVGEAALSPAAYSLIADYFSPHRRSTAMSVYSMGIYIGAGLAFIVGGLVVEYAGTSPSTELPLIGAVRSWQLVFLVVGLAGLPVALLLLTVREPIRRGPRRATGSAPASATLAETWDFLRDNRATFLCLNLGIALVTLNAYAASSWIPTLFIRRHGWTAKEIGLVYGLIVAIGGTLGIVSGGRLADSWRAQGRTDANLRVALLGTIGWFLCGPAYLLAPSPYLSAALLAPATFCVSMPFGVAPAAIQQVMPNPMRAQATAIYLFVINLVGMGAGPTVAAALTEHVFRDKTALHCSLLLVGLTSHLVAAGLLCAGLARYRRSLEYLGEWSAGHA